MYQIVSIVGKSGSGKTTLMERLIIELSKRGHKVGIIKHSHHDNDLDTPEKDTWRYTKAGSAFSAINSLDHLAVYRHIDADHYFDPAELSDTLLWDFDFILTEGFKECNYPKIEVHDPARSKELVTDPGMLLAVVSDEPLDNDVPRFTRDDIGGIADLIETTLENGRLDEEVEMVVNGERVVLTPSLRDLLGRTMQAMVPAGSGNDGIRNIHLSLRRKY